MKLLTPTRRKLLLGGAALIASPAIVRASMTLTGVGVPAAAVGGTVAFDAYNTGTASNVGTLTFTLTPVGTPTAVAVSVLNYNGTTTILSVTYGLASMALAVAQVFDSSNGSASIYGLANPSSGPQSVLITFSGGSGYAVAGAVSVTGSDTSTCFRASSPTSLSGSSATSSGTLAVTSASGDLAIDIFGAASASGDTFTAGGTQTQRWQASSGTITAAQSTLPATSSSTNMSWGIASNFINFGYAAAAFKHA